MIVEHSTQNKNNLIVNGGILIFRDNEMFTRKTGLGFHHIDIVQKVHTKSPDKIERPETILWLPNETNYVLGMLEPGKPLQITGGVGEGKSAIMYGLRSTLRAQENPYLYIDGHYTNTFSKKIDAAITWAENNRATLFWDSFDYLVVRDRRIRKLSLKDHQMRSTSLIDRVNTFVRNDGTFVFTTHTEPWLIKHADTTMLTGLDWQILQDSAQTHTVSGVFQNTDEASQFYIVSLDINHENAEYLASLPYNEMFIKFLKENIDSNDTEKIIQSLKTYRMAKIIVFDNVKKNEEVLKNIFAFFKNQISEEELWSTIALYVMLKSDYLDSLVN